MEHDHGIESTILYTANYKLYIKLDNPPVPLKRYSFNKFDIFSINLKHHVKNCLDLAKASRNTRHRESLI